MKAASEWRVSSTATASSDVLEKISVDDLESPPIIAIVEAVSHLQDNGIVNISDTPTDTYRSRKDTSF